MTPPAAACTLTCAGALHKLRPPRIAAAARLPLLASFQALHHSLRSTRETALRRAQTRKNKKKKKKKKKCKPSMVSSDMLWQSADGKWEKNILDRGGRTRQMKIKHGGVGENWRK